MSWWVGAYTENNQAKFFKDGKWTLPDTIMADAAKHHGYDKPWFTDAWGTADRNSSSSTRNGITRRVIPCSMNTCSCPPDRTASSAPTTT